MEAPPENMGCTPQPQRRVVRRRRCVRHHERTVSLAPHVVETNTTFIRELAPTPGALRGRDLSQCRNRLAPCAAACVKASDTHPQHRRVDAADLGALREPPNQLVAPARTR